MQDGVRLLIGTSHFLNRLSGGEQSLYGPMVLTKHLGIWRDPESRNGSSAIPQEPPKRILLPRAESIAG
jgi:hypothetical protein